ncbi:hypothetical protein MSIMFI_05549 [Mycobacterium simulans]|nr:hypothetical protein MSIMFI_05549 [Mycobacterium simulans]
MSADFDLFVGAADVVQLAIGAPAHQVSGLIHPRAGAAERTGHKPGCGQRRSAPIPTRHPGAGHVQLTDHSGRHRPQPPIQHKQRRTRHRASDRRRPGTRFQWRTHRYVHRGLGRAVLIDHDPSAGPPVHDLGRAGLTADDQCRRFQALGRQHRYRRRGLNQQVDFFGDKQIVKLVGGAGDRFGDHQQPRAMKECGPNLKYGKVKGIGMTLGRRLARFRYERRWYCDQLDDVVVGDRDALGPSGGAGGIDDMGDVVGRRYRQRGWRVGNFDRRVIDIDDHQASSVQSAREFGPGDHGRWGGVFDDEIDAGVGGDRVDG